MSHVLALKTKTVDHSTLLGESPDGSFWSVADPIRRPGGIGVSKPDDVADNAAAIRVRDLGTAATLLINALQEIHPEIGDEEEPHSPLERLEDGEYVPRQARPWIPAEYRQDVSVRTFLDSVETLPRLTQAGVIDRFRASKWGSAGAFWQIVLSGLRLCIKVAWQNSRDSHEFLDNIQEGFFGLIRAAELYDPGKAKFTTYSSHWILQRMMRAKTSASIIRLPVHVSDRLGSLRRRLELDWVTYGHLPALEEPRDSNLIQAMCAAFPTIELTENVETSRLSVEDWLIKDYLSLSESAPAWVADPDADETTPKCFWDTDSPESIFMEKAEQESVAEALRILTDREQFVLRRYFGFDGNDPSTLEEVGTLIGVTRERVRQIIARAIGRLGSPKYRRLLRPGEMREPRTNPPGQIPQADRGKYKPAGRKAHVVRAAGVPRDS